MPEEIQGEVGVIPDVQVKGQVHEAAADKLHGGNDGSACGGAEEDMLLIPSAIDMIDGIKANPPADRHRPMGVTAAEELQGIVGSPAYGEACKLAEGADGFADRHFLRLRIHKNSFQGGFRFSIHRMGEK